MNTLSSLLNWIGNTIGANPSTLTTASKTLVGAINEVKSKSLVDSVTEVYWWQNSWTAPSDGMLVLRITPNTNASWYWYINDTSINATAAGTWSHQFRGGDGNTVTYCIPVKKGATYSTTLSNNLGTILCFFYPMKVGSGVA